MNEKVVWLGAGFVGFWLARAAWQLHFGCKPITVGTIIGSVVASVLGPVLWFAAAIWAIMHLVEGSKPSWLHRILRTELFNPCKKRDTTT